MKINFYQLIMVALTILMPITVTAQVTLLEENFDGLTLREAPKEQPTPNLAARWAGKKVWTNEPPAGWTVTWDEDNNVPDGILEWQGWSFAIAEWWEDIAGDQDRSRFTDPTKQGALAENIIAIADPDEYDDRDLGNDRSPLHNGGYDTSLSTPAIDISKVNWENSIELSFSSSWRPEDTQLVTVTVLFDGGDPIELLCMESITPSPGVWQTAFKSEFLKPRGKTQALADLANVSEKLAFNIPNPVGAQRMVISWNMPEAENDWWWAIDHIRVTVPDAAFSVVPTGTLPISDQESPQWGLPKGAKARLGKGSINKIQYSPDGARLAVAGSIGIWLYDTVTHQEVALLTGHTGEVLSVAFSPDGPLRVEATTKPSVCGMR